MKKLGEVAKLYQVVARAYAERETEVDIRPFQLADRAMNLINFSPPIHPLGYLAAHLESRQIARSYCDKKHGVDDDDDLPEPLEPSELSKGPVQYRFLFPMLQRRYPTARSQALEPDQREYRQLPFLTDEDIAFNVQRLRKEGNAKLAHADALEAYGRSRKYL